MSAVPGRVRRLVESRAAGRCEYCRFPAVAQATPFQVEHIVPRSAGGSSVAANLAWACGRCNTHKSDFQFGTDPASGGVVALFNPRTDVWSGHFAWSVHDPAVLVGRTPCGRATVRRLRLNDRLRVIARRQLLRLGISLDDE